MNVDSIFNIAFLIFSVAFVLFFVILGIAVLVAWFIAKNNKKRYKIAVIKIITAAKKKKDTEILASMKSEYENYRKSVFSDLGCCQLNCELVSELRGSMYMTYYRDELKNASIVADTIERINFIWNDELTFTDEKIQKTFDQIVNLSYDAKTKQDAEAVVSELKTDITSFNSFCNGRIFEMNNKLVDMEYKLKKHNIKIFFAWLGWIVGLVSGIVTIFHL